MKTKLFLLVFFHLISASCFCQWYYHCSFPSYFSDVIFSSSDTGLHTTSYAGMPSGFGVYFTKNGAQTWNVLNGCSDPNSNGCLSYNLFLDKKSNTFYNINSYHQYMYVNTSTNYGISWKSTYVSTWLYRGFSSPDTSQWFMLQQSSKYYLHKYQNGTLNTKVDSFSIEKPASIFFPVIDTGFIAASTSSNPNNHIVLKSTAGGTNWSYVFNDSLMNIRKMYFTSANIGYAVGSTGKIIRTIDGGINWQYLNSGTTLNLNSTCFINDTIGFAAGDSGLIIKTIDGGTSWHQQATGITGDFSKIFFVNDSVGFAVSGNDLFKTTQSPFMGISDSPAENFHILISPNPVVEKVTIKSTVPIFSMELLNSMGERIYFSIINSLKTEIDLSNLPSGIYFLHTNTIIGSQSKKIIRE